MTNALIIFIKNPVKGRVKTRLAKDTDDDYALQVYLELQKVTMNLASQVQADKYLYYSSHIQLDDMWDNCTFNKMVQDKGDLGHKMNAAIRNALLSYRNVVIIGSDCIQLDKDIVELAFRQLNLYDIVIGPALDGGYYLLGINSPCDQLFKGIDWGTPTVLEMTIQKAFKCNKSCYLLPELSDIDHLEDWEKYGYKL